MFNTYFPAICNILLSYALFCVPQCSLTWHTIGVGCQYMDGTAIIDTDRVFRGAIIIFLVLSPILKLRLIQIKTRSSHFSYGFCTDFPILFLLFVVNHQRFDENMCLNASLISCKLTSTCWCFPSSSVINSWTSLTFFAYYSSQSAVESCWLNQFYVKY